MQEEKTNTDTRSQICKYMEEGTFRKRTQAAKGFGMEIYLESEGTRIPVELEETKQEENDRK